MPGRFRTASRPSRTVMSLAPYSRGFADSAGVSGVRASSTTGSTARSVLSLATGAVDSSVLDDGRLIPPPSGKGTRQQAQTYGADGLLTVGVRTRVLKAPGERTQSTFHPRPVIYNDSTGKQPIFPHSGAVDGKLHGCGRPLAAPRAPQKDRPRGPIHPPALPALYTALGAFSRVRPEAIRRCPVVRGR